MRWLESSWPRRLAFGAAIIAIGAASWYHRYYGIQRQLPLDDEWHSLFRAASGDVGELATHYLPRATAMPVNVYQRWLLETWGWSEVSIRLPSMAATAVTLLLLPFVVLRVSGSRLQAVFAAVLFGSSQFWILYAQSSRPYAAFLAFLLAAYFALWRALRSTRRLWFVVFGLSGALAVYFHLYALPALAALGPAALGHTLLARRGGEAGSEFRRRLLGVALGFGTLGACTLALFGPALANGIVRNLPREESSAALNEDFFRHALELLTSSRSSWVGFVCCELSLVGLFLLWRKDRLFTTLLLCGLVGTLCFTLVAEPQWYFVAFVSMRYNITIFLLYFLGMSTAFAKACELARRGVAARPRVSLAVSSASVALVAGLLVWLSPIPRSRELSPNNFRLHRAYQESYGGFDPERMFASDLVGGEARRPRAVSKFYSEVASTLAKPCRLVEYPLQYSDDQNPYYLYQRLHGCDAYLGFAANDSVGKRLRAKENQEAFRFRRVVYLDDAESVDKTRATHLVVHLDMRRELRLLLGKRAERPNRHLASEVKRVLELARVRYGEPVYQDEFVRVFVLGPRSQG